MSEEELCASMDSLFVSKQEHNEKICLDSKEKSMYMEKSKRIERLSQHLQTQSIKHENQIMNLDNLKDAHVYCVIYDLSAQQYGPLLEKFINQKFHFTKNKSKEAKGDSYKDGINVEIKVSLGGTTHKKFNFVQIRPSHHCHYILTAYHLSKENIDEEGELYVFRIKGDEMKNIILHFGSYAHGTKKEYGNITTESLEDESNTKEYAIRPIFQDDCWKSLLPFRIHESSLS